MQLDKLKVSAPAVLRMIPDELLAVLARNTKVDYCAKVLKGERLFYLLVYALLCADRLSQRKLEAVFASQHFKSLFNFSVDMKVTRSSISTRLSTVNLDFFEQAYGLLYERLSSLYTEKEIRDMYLVRIDSSMVAETCNKLKAGFTVGRKAEGRDDRRQIKYTMAYDGFAAKLAELSELRDHTLVVECYPGVSDEVLELVRGAFKPDAVILSDDVFYDGEELTRRMLPHLTDDRVRGVMYYGRLEDFVDPAALAAAKAAVPEGGRTLVYGVDAGLVATGDTLVYCDLARWEIELRYRAGMPNFRAHNEGEDSLRKIKRGYFV